MKIKSRYEKLSVDDPTKSTRVFQNRGWEIIEFKIDHFLPVRLPHV